MFESVVGDPGEEALQRAARIFRVLAVLVAASILLLAVSATVSDRPLQPILMLVNAVLAAVAWVTAGGIEQRKNWARLLGVAFGVVELVNIPVGTMVGIFVLIYLNRAGKAGLFKPASTEASSERSS